MVRLWSKPEGLPDLVGVLGARSVVLYWLLVRKDDQDEISPFLILPGDPAVEISLNSTVVTLPTGVPVPGHEGWKFLQSLSDNF